MFNVYPYLNGKGGSVYIGPWRKELACYPVPRKRPIILGEFVSAPMARKYLIQHTDNGAKNPPGLHTTRVIQSPQSLVEENMYDEAPNGKGLTFYGVVPRISYAHTGPAFDVIRDIQGCSYP